MMQGYQKTKTKRGKEVEAGMEIMSNGTKADPKEEETKKEEKGKNGSGRFRWKKENYLVLVLIGVLILVAAWPAEKQSRKLKKENSAGITEILSGTGNDEEGRDTYVISLERSLEELLSSMEGVGENKVMITLKPSERSMYYASGSTMEIEGVVVCAKGAANGKVAKNISEVIQALFGLEAHKIKIAKMR